MSSNTPTLTQSEENRAPWNDKENKVKVDVTVSITMSKHLTIEVDVTDIDDDNKLMTAFDSQKYSPEQISAILNEYSHRKVINNIQTKLKDLSGWNVDEKCIVKE